MQLLPQRDFPFRRCSIANPLWSAPPVVITSRPHCQWLCKLNGPMTAGLTDWTTSRRT